MLQAAEVASPAEGSSLQAVSDGGTMKWSTKVNQRPACFRMAFIAGAGAKHSESLSNVCGQTLAVEGGFDGTGIDLSVPRR